MDHLWSPWRMKYISRSEKKAGCIFCNAADCTDSEENLIVRRTKLAFVILNRYPYNNGHLMVVPNRHAPNLATLSADEQAELMQLTRRGEIAITEAYAPQGPRRPSQLNYT